MRKRLFRLALAITALGILATPSSSAAASGCPSHLTNGLMACHNTGGSDCSACDYHCDDGEDYTWNVCDLG